MLTTTFRSTLALMFALCCSLAVMTGCEDDNDLDDAADNTRDAVDDAADDTGDALDDAGDAIDDSVDDAGDAIDDATD